ncbi:RlpA-like double-psi beta-barrel-protein domain-containing protein-containing protein [Scenedesmus sp. NREL 46B-D3]|nr:RlpA-like double-psi beta-barrel-protein domain-containing protein-containing protein [Scenedesmus sp. NREL 46B-D3]
MAALALMGLLLLAAGSSVSAWKSGRATFYGNEPWYWSIHYGSCGQYYQWPDQGMGWDVAALNDGHPEHGCPVEPAAAGENIDRNGVCRDTSASVVVKITDTCPCSYPNNYFSNKRWCCGDMDHLDMSVWAFQKLTDMKWGVIPIQYRRVDCGQQPDNKAHLNYDEMFPGEFPPKSQAGERGDFDWHKYFPKGGYMNSKAGDGSYMVSTDEFLGKIGRSGGGSGGSSAQYGK